MYAPPPAWTTRSPQLRQPGRSLPGGAARAARAKYAYFTGRVAHDNLERREAVPSGGVDGHQASINDQMAALAHARAPDQALAPALEAVRAGPGPRRRLRVEGDLPDPYPPARVLLHHSAVLAVLGARPDIRHRWGRPARDQLLEADAIRARPVPARQQHRKHRGDDPCIQGQGPRAAHRRRRRGHAAQRAAPWTHDLHVKPLGDPDRPRRWRIVRPAPGRIPHPAAWRLPPVSRRTGRRGAFDEAALRPPLQGGLSRRPLLREPLHHGHGPCDRELRALTS